MGRARGRRHAALRERTPETIMTAISSPAARSPARTTPVGVRAACPTAWATPTFSSEGYHFKG